MRNQSAQRPDATEPVLRVRLRAVVDEGMTAFLAIFGLLLGVLMMGRHGGPAPAAYLFLAAPVLLAPWMVPFRAWIGSDGVYVGRFYNRRFIPAASIREAWVRPAEPVEKLVKGELPAAILALPEGRLALVPHGGEDEARAIVARVERMIAPRGAPPDPRAALARGGRTVAAWREHLARALRPGFRAAALSTDDLRAILVDPAAPTEQRLGAALGLGAVGAADGRAQVRIAAEATARPALRVALERIAAGDAEDEEAAIEEAIAEESRAAAE